MNKKLWLLQLPFVGLFSFLFWVSETGVQGQLHNKFLREKVYPGLTRINGVFTDNKFKLRGSRPTQNKIVVVEVDSSTLEVVGRWPWHRDSTGFLIDKVFEAGAKVVGLDIIFPEPDKRVSDELAQELKKHKLAKLVDQFETDFVLEDVIKRHKDNLVMGFASESACQPLYSATEDCPITNPDALATHPEGFEKFAFTHFKTVVPFEPTKTPVLSMPLYIGNIPIYNSVAKHTAYLNNPQDPDGVNRRTSLLMLADGKAYPSLALEMARVGLGEDLSVSFDEKHRVKTLGFAKSGRMIPITPTGAMEINFRGPSRTFHYVSAMEIMGESDTLEDPVNRKLAGMSKRELLKDAYVLIGVSAIGAFDLRNFPYESGVPGVDGHANILENLLSGDPMVPGSGGAGTVIILLLMTAGALGFGYATQKLEAVPALGLFAGIFAAVAIIDTKLLFGHNMNWNMSYLFMELISIFVFTLAAKYVMEENNKKFLRAAFTKYVAPAVVDSILKDPTKLSLGGEKRELTILFSDIRSFTTFSEKMDAKQLAAFLNDYLGIMTNIVFSHGGTLDKYIGDAVMAFWGAPLDQKDHAVNACKAAQAMMVAMYQHKDRFKSQYGIDVAIGIGLNSGVVNVGNMGSENNFEYTVIGDHVNLASRLEGLTKAYATTIVTSRFTFDCVKASGHAEPKSRVLDFVKVKGKKKAVELLEIADREYNPEGIKAWNEGQELYRSQRWDEAIAKFKRSAELLATAPGVLDGPSGVFIERCEDFKKAPPEKDWDGSWEMHSK